MQFAASRSQLPALNTGACSHSNSIATNTTVSFPITMTSTAHLHLPPCFPPASVLQLLLLLVWV